MRAVVITEPGVPGVMEWRGGGGVTGADWPRREGPSPPPRGPPPYPGLEVSGRIRAVGDQVTGWRPGAGGCALLGGGGYAEQVAVPPGEGPPGAEVGARRGGGGYAEQVAAPQGQVLPVPDAVPVEAAAALPEVACTVWVNIVDLARLTAGETLLVHGGASGIGTHAIQLAKAMGVRVICTAGSVAKLARCRELRADVAINYHTEDFVAAVMDATSGAGADVILDILGASYLARNVAALAVNGRLSIVGIQSGTKAEFDIGALLAKRGSIHATGLRVRPPHEKAAIVAGVRELIWPLVSTGKIVPVVDRVLPMTQADR